MRTKVMFTYKWAITRICCSIYMHITWVWTLQYMIDRIGGFVHWCLTARQCRKVNLCLLREQKSTQPANDGQQDTMHNTLHNYNETQFTVKKKLQLHQRNNRLSNRMIYLLMLAHSPTQEISHTPYSI